MTNWTSVLLQREVHQIPSVLVSTSRIISLRNHIEVLRNLCLGAPLYRADFRCRQLARASVSHSGLVLSVLFPASDKIKECGTAEGGGPLKTVIKRGIQQLLHDSKWIILVKQCQTWVLSLVGTLCTPKMTGRLNRRNSHLTFLSKEISNQ